MPGAPLRFTPNAARAMREALPGPPSQLDQGERLDISRRTMTRYENEGAPLEYGYAVLGWAMLHAPDAVDNLRSILSEECQ